MPRRKLYGTCKVGPYKVRILLLPKEQSNKEHLFGYAASPDGVPEIALRVGMPTAARDETLLHEMLHVCSGVSGLGLTEKQVGALSPLLYQAISSLKVR